MKPGTGLNLGKLEANSGPYLQKSTTWQPGFDKRRLSRSNSGTWKIPDHEQYQDQDAEKGLGKTQRCTKTSCPHNPANRMRSTITPAARLAPDETTRVCHAGAVEELGLQRPGPLGLHVKAAPTSADNVLQPPLGWSDNRGSRDNAGCAVPRAEPAAAASILMSCRCWTMAKPGRR